MRSQEPTEFSFRHQVESATLPTPRSWSRQPVSHPLTRTEQPLMAVTPRVHNGVVIDFATDLPTDSTCTCEADRVLTADRTFEIAPDAGGGWTSWARALTRLFTSLAARPTHCLVITQEPNQRYVQLAIGHGNVRLEASSNTYLTGDFRLSPADEERLLRVGFRSPWDEVEHEYARPKNWWLEEPIGHPIWITELVTHTLISIMAFDSRYPATITMFGADTPCKACS
jgi:hypothetical protein